MDHREVGKYWNGNASVWTQLARAGYDVYRDYLNTPAFLAMLPDVRGLSGIDIGCGEGHNTRLIARRGARLAGIDISDVFIRYAIEEEQREPLGINFHIASAVAIPFPDSHFDFAVAVMSLMDMPDTEIVLAEVLRIIKPGGFLQFSITHPCSDVPHRKNLRDDKRRSYAFELGGYFENLEGDMTEWIFSTTPEELKRKLPKFKIPRFMRRISQWLNLLIETGFTIERVEEPIPSTEAVRACPAVQDAKVIPFFLHIRARKPGVNEVNGSTRVGDR
ncbi:methyltransferase domain-containing protein [bacterium]|nr:methyltransferase domain-containing protein [candidate division CSSED10-310 bacterium]